MNVFFKRHRYTKIAKIFILYTIFISIYCLGSAFGLMATTMESIKFWTVVQYMGLPFSPPMGLIFTMKYLGYKASGKKVLSLFILPVASLIMVATNDFHHLYYRVYEVDPLLGAPFVHQEIGFWYMIQGVFTFACMFTSLLLTIARWRETAKVYRPQLFALLCGQLFPIVTAFVYLNGLTPPGVDPVPMILWVSSGFYMWSISTSRLFSIMPIAKDTIFNSIDDGVIVLDKDHRLIEYNHAARTMFLRLDTSLLGNDFQEVWRSISGSSFPFKMEKIPLTQELQQHSGQIEKVYQMRTCPLHQGKERNGMLLILTDITELKILQKKLEHQAYYDELTQVHNRRAFFEKAEKSLSAVKERNVPFSVILMDIDHFKQVNDTYGHDMGDKLLFHVSRVCQSQLAEGMIFARYGGEEFVIGIRGMGAAECGHFADRLRESIENHPLESEEEILRVTISLGIAESTMKSDETLYQLLNQADKALYSAKRAGRNQVCIYSEEASIFT